MPGSSTIRVACAALLFVGGWASAAAAEKTIRDPGTFVVDTAGVIDAATAAKLEGHLAELQQKTSAQVKVLTVQTADGEDIQSFTQRHFDAWQLGQRGKDNGVLIVLDVGDHKVQIEPGYGLEAALPDAFCGSLSRKIRDEYFRGGRYGEGLYQMAAAVANKIADEQHQQLTGVPDIRHVTPNDGNSWIAALFVLIFALITLYIFYSAMRRQHHRRVWRSDLTDGWYWGRVLGDTLMTSAATWSSGSSSSSSGSFGGGGGSFGGGGSSGGGGGGASW